MISVPGDTSWPVKRRAESTRCCGENGRNSGDVAREVLEQALAREAIERFGELAAARRRGAQRVGAGSSNRPRRRPRPRPSAAARRPARARRRSRLRRGAPARSACQAVGGEDAHVCPQRRERSWCRARLRAPPAAPCGRRSTRTVDRTRENDAGGSSDNSGTGGNISGNSVRLVVDEAASAAACAAAVGIGLVERASAAAPPSSDRAAPVARRDRDAASRAVELRQRLVQRARRRRASGAPAPRRARAAAAALQVVEGDRRVDAPREIVHGARSRTDRRPSCARRGPTGPRATIAS